MSTLRCTKTPGVNCARVLGHAGVCCACPSAATLDWDMSREAVQQQHIEAAVTLLALDWETPWYGDLRDPLDD